VGDVKKGDPCKLRAKLPTDACAMGLKCMTLNLQETFETKKLCVEVAAPAENGGVCGYQYGKSIPCTKGMYCRRPEGKSMGTCTGRMYGEACDERSYCGKGLECLKSRCVRAQGNAGAACSAIERDPVDGGYLGVPPGFSGPPIPCKTGTECVLTPEGGRYCARVQNGQPFGGPCGYSNGNMLNCDKGKACSPETKKCVDQLAPEAPCYTTGSKVISCKHGYTCVADATPAYGLFVTPPNGKCKPSKGVVGVAKGGLCSIQKPCAQGLMCQGGKCLVKFPDARAGELCGSLSADTFVACAPGLLCSARTKTCGQKYDDEW
jgi:hypothetical protein